MNRAGFIFFLGMLLFSLLALRSNRKLTACSGLYLRQKKIPVKVQALIELASSLKVLIHPAFTWNKRGNLRKK